MKLSNKLIVGGLLTIFLMIASIHIALYAKYKKGDYTIYQPLKPMQTFPGVQRVSIHNLEGVTIQFSNIAGMEKGKEQIADFVQQGDSLVITGRKKDNNIGQRLYLSLTLPRNTSLSVYNSSVSFENDHDTGMTNPIIYLQKSIADFGDNYHPIQLGNVKLVAADHSIVNFNNNTQLNQLNLELMNSVLSYNDGDAGEISIKTDSASRISLPSKLLLKAKISTGSENP